MVLFLLRIFSLNPSFVSFLGETYKNSQSATYVWVKDDTKEPISLINFWSVAISTTFMVKCVPQPPLPQAMENSVSDVLNAGSF